MLKPCLRIAGTHTTSATTSLLFYHLLHNPEYLAELVKEIDKNLPPLDNKKPAYSITEAETLLPFLRDCMRENFRITPVFTMPLARRVMHPEGLVISGQYIPQGVCLPFTTMKYPRLTILCIDICCSL